MFLVKFTDAQWKTAALKERSIRIGSVLHYREIEDSTFRDEAEGEGPIIHKSKTPLIMGKTKNPSGQGLRC
jgi:hypothetical protein